MREHHSAVGTGEVRHIGERERCHSRQPRGDEQAHHEPTKWLLTTRGPPGHHSESSGNAHPFHPQRQPGGPTAGPTTRSTPRTQTQVLDQVIISRP